MGYIVEDLGATDFGLFPPLTTKLLMIAKRRETARILGGP